jgi:hypothetical protein
VTTQHVDDNGRHIEGLDRRLRALRDTFVGLGDTSDVEQMLVIIHRPGWSTPADVHFMNALVAAAQRTADDARQLREALRAGALAIDAAAVQQA